MILEPGKWQGKGSWRPVSDSVGLRFQASIEIDHDAGTEGTIANAILQPDGGSPRAFLVYVVPDEVGTYAVTVRGDGLNVQGTAKLDSEPNLGLMWSEDGSMHVSCALFRLHDTHGVRGFARVGKDTWTWELALRPEHRLQRTRPESQTVSKPGKASPKRGNVVSLFDRLKR